MRGRRFLFTKFVELAVFVALLAVVECQYRRPNPSVSPAIAEWRNRWAEFLRLRASTASPVTIPTRKVHTVTTVGDKMVINGFKCDRTYALFPNKDNSRVYHLCARSRDQWYVYHYFCPHGSIFDDRLKKCMQQRNPTVTQQTSRPVTSTTTEKTTLAPTTTTAIYEPEVEMTDLPTMSSQEFSTEEETGGKDVVVSSIPGMMASSEEVDTATKGHDSSDEQNMIPESDNESSRLPSVSFNKKVTERKPKPTKNAGDAGGRRPRILKKWHGW